MASNTRLPQFLERTQAQGGTRGARFEDSLKLAIERDQRKIDREARTRIYRLEQVEVPRDEPRFGRDRKIEAAELRKDFEHGTRETEFALGRLIRIGRRSNCYLVRSDWRARECARQHLRRHPLDEYAAFEIHRVAQFEEFVRVARVAVNASELASAIRIDRPAKAHPRAGAAVEDLLDRHLEKLDIPSGCELLG